MTARLWPLFAVAIVLIGGCSQSEEVTQKVRIWEEKTSSFFKETRSMEILHSWLREQNVYYTFDEDDITQGSWVIGLETIYVESVRCERFNIKLYVTINSDGNIKSHEVKNEEVCLW